MTPGPVPIDRVTAEDFQPFLGQFFALFDGGTRTPLELVAVRRRSARPGDFARREPFSLLFRAEPSVVKQQQIFRLEHPTLGAMELFLAPCRSDATGCYYNAAFN